MAHRPIVSDHFDGKLFHNVDPQARELKSLVDVLKWKLLGQSALWPAAVINDATPAVAALVPAGEAAITAINHATLLVQLAGLTVLTDPVFSERASPVQFAGPRRVRAPGIALEALPTIDVVVISHNHYDHLDVASVRALWQRHRPLFVVPCGNAALLADQGVERIIELDWWQSHALPGGASVVLTEAQHWSARGLGDRNRALWGGFVMRAGNVGVFFAGDTGYSSHFARVRERSGPIDVALLPIGAYEPRWFMKAHHMDPDDAVRAHLDLGARQSIGIHFGTFQLTSEAIDDPPRRLAVARAAHGVDAGAFVALVNGQTLIYRTGAMPE